MILTLQHSPVTPFLLLPFAPMIPATWVPWPCSSSPEPLPSTTSPPQRSSMTPLWSSSLPLDGSLVFSHRLPLRSGWLLCTPVSSTATFAQLVRLSHAAGASMSWSSFCLIAYCSTTPGSLGLFSMLIAVSSSTRCTRSLLRRRVRSSSRLTPLRRPTAAARTRRRRCAELAARALDDLLEAGAARVAAELDEQPRDGRRRPVRPRQPIASEAHRGGGRRGQAGGQDDGGSERDEARRHVHAAQRTGAMRRSHRSG